MILRHRHEYALHHTDGRVSPVYGYLLFVEITKEKDIVSNSNVRIWAARDQAKQKIQYIKRP